MYYKLFFLALIGLSLPFGSHAQLQFASEVGLAAVTQTWSFDGNSPSDERVTVRPRLMLEFGGSLRYSVTEQIQVSGGLRLAGRGSTLYVAEEVLGERLTAKTKTTIGYLQIPVGILFQPTSDVPVLLEGGLAWAMAFSGDFRTITRFGGERDTDTEDIDFGNDLGELKGTDLRFYLGGRTIILDGRAEVGGKIELGLQNLANFRDDALRNHALTVFVAIPLQIL